MFIESITIAIKFDFGWSIDTYTRWLPTLNNKITNDEFVISFMKEYQGNAIETVKVIENGKLVYCNNMVEVEGAIDDLRKNIKGLNETILTY